jgi:hypothetical protein
VTWYGCSRSVCARWDSMVPCYSFGPSAWSSFCQYINFLVQLYRWYWSMSLLVWFYFIFVLLVFLDLIYFSYPTRRTIRSIWGIATGMMDWTISALEMNQHGMILVQSDARWLSMHILLFTRLMSSKCNSLIKALEIGEMVHVPSTSPIVFGLTL